MAVPPKYREMGDFHEYYRGIRKAPFLTIFIGGNHEASNHGLELFYGGWVAPNIYYMGAAGVIRCGPLRIAGLSGIWKGYDYRKPHHEQPPFGQDDVKSVYHIREYDVIRLLHIRTQVDIGISHDWPRGVEWMGDFSSLFKIKPFFEEEARSNILGSPVTRDLLNHLRPSYWFSAHLHCKYAAVINHSDASNTALEPVSFGDGPSELSATGEATKNPDEIEIESDASSAASIEKSHPSTQVENSQSPGTQNDCRQLPTSFNSSVASPSASYKPTSISNNSTRFLALDKCLPGRQFLQLLEIEPIHKLEEVAEPPYLLTYDKEWLALNRVFSTSLGLGPTKAVEKSEVEARYTALMGDAEAWVEDNLVKKGKMAVPQNFEITVSTSDFDQDAQAFRYTKENVNPQTASFCEMLQIPNPYPFDGSGRGSSNGESVNGNTGHQAPRSYRGRAGNQRIHRRGDRGRRGY